MVISRKFLIAAVVILLYFIMWRKGFRTNAGIGTIAAVIVDGIFVFLYLKDVKKIFDIFRKKVDKE